AGLVSYEMLLRLGRIEGVEGIKYTSSTVFDIFRIKEALGQDFAVYSGSDELAVSGLAFGADGIIGSTYNVLTPLFLKLNAQMAAGDVIAARETQKIANKLIFALLARGLMPSLKATLTLGGRVDGGISRRPFFQLTEEQHEALKAEYRAIKAAHGDLGLDFSRRSEIRAVSVIFHNIGRVQGSSPVRAPFILNEEESPYVRFHVSRHDPAPRRF
ncbi:MAG: dihydrodipicolinate synthase family protein, partial [Christensenellales bacterium]